MDIDPSAVFTHLKDLISRYHRFQMLQRLVFDEPVDHTDLLILRHGSHTDLHQKTVQLRLRKRESPQRLHRVLRCHDKERFFQFPGLTIHRDLPLCHTLKQS